MSDSDALADLEGIPEEAKALWVKLLDQDLAPVNQLFGEVREYQKEIATKTQYNDDVDPTLARRLTEASLKLLGTIKEDTPAETRKLIQACVRYFVVQEDAESDLDSVIGLDDDAEVINAVLRHLGRTDWMVPIH